jgi:hypothetical protein
MTLCALFFIVFSCAGLRRLNPEPRKRHALIGPDVYGTCLVVYDRRTHLAVVCVLLRVPLRLVGVVSSKQDLA